jgi:hypothetical protein
MDILLGLFLIAFGVAIAALGIQIFFAMLPLLGFVAGFYVGAAGVEALFGDGFLSTFTGWIAGIVVGLVFAVIAYVWWYVGVLISAGASGALLATALAVAIGINSSFILFVFAVVGAIVVVFAALSLNLPIYVVIVNTAIAGASIVISGVMLMFNRIQTADLEEGFAVAMTEASWWWVLLWGVVAAIGMGRQLMLKDRIRLPAERWTTATA